MTEEQISLQWLSSILDILRHECPWDSIQTIDSLRYLTIEEVYELSETIASGNRKEMKGELGDLFMHLLFYAKIANDEGFFGVSDILDSICQKLIHRHPHISLPDRDGIMQPAKSSETPKWEQVKMQEQRHSVLEGVPANMPPLVKAVRMQEKAAGMGFEFPNSEMAHQKVCEEYNEFLEALNENDKKHAEEELGDLLFAIVKWARLEGLNADDALTRANQKFQQRFSLVEKQALENNKNLSDLTIDELVAMWNKAKTTK